MVWKLSAAIIVIVLAAQTLLFRQNDYVILLDHIEVLWINTTIVEHLDLKFFRYNRSTSNKALNLSVKFKMDLPSRKVQFHMQSYKFQSNEYRLFPINFTTDGCQMLKEDTFGVLALLKHHSNMVRCPFKKGIDYYVANYLMDQSKWPPHVPTGMFKSEVFMYCNKTVGVTKMASYVEVKEIYPWDRKKIEV